MYVLMHHRKHRNPVVVVFLTAHPCITGSFHLQFAEKFAEFKEAARLAKEKSQEKIELTSTPSQVGTFSLPSCQVVPTEDLFLKANGTSGETCAS